MPRKKNMTIKLERIELKEEDLLFTETFIKRLGGKAMARIALLDIIDRYFNNEYIDHNLITN